MANKILMSLLVSTSIMTALYSVVKFVEDSTAGAFNLFPATLCLAFAIFIVWKEK